MSTPRPAPTPIQKVADETQEKLMRHMEANTEEEDARREAERDARMAALLKQFEEEGNLPPRKPSPKKVPSGA